MIGYNLAETFAILLLMSIEGAISNALSGAGGVIEGLPGLLILAVAYVVTLGCILTYDVSGVSWK